MDLAVSSADDAFALTQLDGVSPEAGGIFYGNETRAMWFEMTDYRRLLGSMEDFHLVPGYPRDPRRIADLGGGTGVLSMYLAELHPKSTVIVYDHAPAALRYGQKLAKKKKIHNIKFRSASYRQLASKSGPQNNDLVLISSAFDSSCPGPGLKEMSTAVDPSWPKSPCPKAVIQDALHAMASLLGVDGVGVISGAPTGWWNVHLFSAIRRAGLGVDWRLCKISWKTGGRQPQLFNQYIVVRRNMPHLGRHGREDAQAIEYRIDADLHHFQNDSKEFVGKDIRSVLTSLCDANQFMTINGVSQDGIEQVTLLQDHRLFLQINLNGRVKSWELHPLNNIANSLSECVPYVQRWTKVTNYKFHPRLQKLMRSWKRYPTAEPKPDPTELITVLRQRKGS
jgi:hypothetical protein